MAFTALLVFGSMVHETANCSPTCLAHAEGTVNFDGEPIPTSEKTKRAHKLNGNRAPKRVAARRNASIAGATSEPAAQSITHLARSFGCQIEIISSSWAPSLAWPASPAHRTRLILSSRSSGRLVAK